MKTNILIIGAGPIGLLLANFLGTQNIDTVIIDKKNEFDKYSKAIGIMPPSFKILSSLGILEIFTNRGLKINNAVVYGTKNILGKISFKKNKEYDYILSIPQNLTENILHDNLKNFNSALVLSGHEFKKIISNDNTVKTEILDLKKNETIFIESDFLIACDGNKSPVRNEAELYYKGARYKDTFLMADYIDKSGFDNVAQLYFTRYGAVESFPLNDNKRRWIVQTEYYMEQCEKDFIEKEVFKRTGIKIDNSDKISESPFGVQHYIIKSYYKNRIIFCGDSAHSMSPIGGQGMNTGFADVEFIVNVLLNFYKSADPIKLNGMLCKYSRYRKKAALVAIRRAALSMKIGTIKGRFKSAFRNIFIFLLMHSPLVNFIPFYFSMLTIKYRNFDKIKKKDYHEIKSLNANV